uniref:DUF761 domain-containing protein n=1 Tax=Ananas comosus var. bracteatus TaxID=296719 RepID=A0A6V7Q0W8_ANACO|nr:unnamed protein product [Ananas comosus var. bracteatus]
MRNKASLFLKHIFSAIVAAVKEKSMAVKSKTSAIKTRLLIFGLLRNKKVLMSAINHKIHAIMGHEKNEDQVADDDRTKAIVIYNEGKLESSQSPSLVRAELVECAAVEDGYPDLTHSLFSVNDEDEDEDDDEEALANTTGSVIDLVRHAKEETGSEFKLEDEIDHVADVFIRRFHRQMKMQKLESFKRYKEMLERSV